MGRIQSKGKGKGVSSAVTPFKRNIGDEGQQKLDLKQISKFYANIIGYFRIILTLTASSLFPLHSYSASLLIFLSVILDYCDGPVARKYNQCSNFGAILDWIADIGNILLVAMWWTSYLPQYTPLLFLMVMVFVVMCAIETALASIGHSAFMSQVSKQSLRYYIMKPFLNMQGRGYKNSFPIGQLTMISHVFFMLFGVLSLNEHDSNAKIFFYIAICCAPLAFIYVLHDFCYTMTMLQQWREKWDPSTNTRVVQNVHNTDMVKSTQ